MDRYRVVCYYHYESCRYVYFSDLGSTVDYWMTKSIWTSHRVLEEKDHDGEWREWNGSDVYNCACSG